MEFPDVHGPRGGIDKGRELELRPDGAGSVVRCGLGGTFV